MDLISEINMKYMALEAEVDKKLEKVRTNTDIFIKFGTNILCHHRLFVIEKEKKLEFGWEVIKRAPSEENPSTTGRRRPHSGETSTRYDTSSTQTCIEKREEEKCIKLEKNLVDKSAPSVAVKKFSYEEALARNANLLKSLEMSKARLRSRSTFSPIEQILEKATENYRKDLLAKRTKIPSMEVTINNSQSHSVGDSENDYEIIPN